MLENLIAKSHAHGFPTYLQSLKSVALNYDSRISVIQANFFMVQFCPDLTEAEKCLALSAGS